MTAMVQLRTKATTDFDGLVGLLERNLFEAFGTYEGETDTEPMITIHVQGSNYSNDIARYSNELFPKEIRMYVRKHPFAGADEDLLLGVLSQTITTWTLSSLRPYYRHRIELIIESECGDRQKLRSILEIKS